MWPPSPWAQAALSITTPQSLGERGTSRRQRNWRGLEGQRRLASGRLEISDPSLCLLKGLQGC